MKGTPFVAAALACSVVLAGCGASADERMASESSAQFMKTPGVSDVSIKVVDDKKLGRYYTAGYTVDKREWRRVAETLVALRTATEKAKMTDLKGQITVKLPGNGTLSVSPSLPQPILEPATKYAQSPIVSVLRVEADAQGRGRCWVTLTDQGKSKDAYCTSIEPVYKANGDTVLVNVPVSGGAFEDRPC